MSKLVQVMPLPPGTLGAYSVAHTGQPLTFTLAGNDVLFAYQWTAANAFAIIDYVGLSVSVAATITTSVAMAIEMMVAREFFSAMTGGTNLTPTFGAGFNANNQKLKTEMATSLVTDIRQANSRPLDFPLNPYTPDAYGIANVAFPTGTTTGTQSLALTGLWPQGGTTFNPYPLVLNTDEGFVLQVPDGVIGPATGTLRLAVTLRWREMSKQLY